MLLNTWSFNKIIRAPTSLFPSHSTATLGGGTGGDAARPLLIFPMMSYVSTNVFAYGAFVLLSCNNSIEMSTIGIIMLLYVQ